MRRPALWLLFGLLALTPPVHALDQPLVRLSEIVADPQTDWTGDGRITASDEYVELHNPGPDPVDLTGWVLRIADSTPADHPLAGTLVAGALLVVQNPTGDTNNDGHILLLDAQGRVRDEVRYGAWPEATAPTANAEGPQDESLRRLDAWTKGPATPRRPNDALSWRLANTLGASPGWVAPNTTATFTATVYADAANPLVRLSLIEGNVTLHAAESTGSTSLVGNHTLHLGARTPALRWLAERRSGSENETIAVNIDSEAPTMAALASTVWRNATTDDVVAPAASDAGIGGIQYQFRVGGNETPWLALPRLTVHADETTIELRARDAANNTTPWSAPAFVRRDTQGPRIVDLRSEGTQVRLAWDAVEEGAGLASLHLVRTIGSQRMLRVLEPSAQVFVDASLGRAAHVQYELWGEDAVGNRGPSAHLNVTTDAGRPAVKAIRLSKQVWSSGSLEVRIDFDRPMDAEVSPRVTTQPRIELQGGRFLSNKSTYFGTLALPAVMEDGPVEIVVESAVSSDGEELRAPANATLLLDRTPPRLVSDRRTETTSAPRITLTATDAGASRIQWRLYAGNEKEATRQGDDGPVSRVDLPADGPWRLRATAVDAAGLRSAELVLDVVLDRQGPRLEPGSWNGDTLLVRASDDGSGVDWPAVTVSDPEWRLAIDEARQRLTLQPGPNPNATLTVFDRAGNAATLGLMAPSSKSGASDNESGLFEQSSLPPLVSPHAQGPSGWWPPAAAFVGGVAAAIPIRQARKSRRRRRSFAARLRTVLAETAPNDAVKERVTG